ncbi:hypothetical protein SAMN06309944_0237 [Micrococcales bacterium KH10]|nr:hypothetical protein SAMN06309944_0237 [Micrococcales bacterium KH10]
MVAVAEYTPTTEQVRDAYSFDPVAEYHDPITPHHVINGRAFDRWLAAHEAEVKAEALREAVKDIDYAGLGTYEANTVVSWLSTRADRIERDGDCG